MCFSFCTSCFVLFLLQSYYNSHYWPCTRLLNRISMWWAQKKCHAWAGLEPPIQNSENMFQHICEIRIIIVVIYHCVYAFDIYFSGKHSGKCVILTQTLRYVPKAYKRKDTVLPVVFKTGNLILLNNFLTCCEYYTCWEVIVVNALLILYKNFFVYCFVFSNFIKIACHYWINSW